ncbi:hypothetical protein [Nocardia sp. XZ_19_385]|uniref:hypothetical protein n=1 Tax=Nocardia sp. XZ_19_385 TaxID=2769488 RepID=UPI001E33B9C1|nr:hypothetical protein [Nocardia sp. XZ_19_385]
MVVLGQPVDDLAHGVGGHAGGGKWDGGRQAHPAVDHPDQLRAPPIELRHPTHGDEVFAATVQLGQLTHCLQDQIVHDHRESPAGGEHRVPVR